MTLLDAKTSLHMIHFSQFQDLFCSKSYILHILYLQVAFVRLKMCCHPLSTKALLSGLPVDDIPNSAEVLSLPVLIL